jgi:hypothetical protein
VIIVAEGATLKLNSIKTAQLGAHQSPGKWGCNLLSSPSIEKAFCAYLSTHVRELSKTNLSAYWDSASEHRDVSDRDVSLVFKLAATVLDYPASRGSL